MIVTLIAGLLAANSCIALASENEVRKSISLDGEWSFALDPQDVGEKENWWGPAKTFAEKIKVPGCWQAQGFGDPQCCLRHHYEGPAWYKKSVAIPSDWKGKTLWLKIGGAARRTKVYVNGKMVGSHNGFLTPFRFDISDVASLSDENLVALRVENSGGGPLGCFNYLGNWGGVYRPIEIEAANSPWIEDVFVIPDIDHSRAKLQITLGAKEKLPQSRVKLKVRIFPLVVFHPQLIGLGATAGLSSSAENTVGQANRGTHETTNDSPLAMETKKEFVAEKDLDVTQASGGLETEIAVALSDVKLWFPETPHLYAAEVVLSGDRGVLDVQRVRFGMRKIDWSGGRLKINRRPYFLRGYGDDNVEVMTGLPPASKEFFIKRLALTKSLGFNDVRFHSNVPFEECFEAADEAGMIVQAELPAVYIDQFLPNKEALRKELVRIVKSYRNHPSFFSLALGNELWLGEIERMPAPQKKEFLDAIREFYDLAKKLDPTRPILSNDGDPNLLPTDIHSGAGPTGQRPFLCHEYGGYRGSLPDIESRNRFTGLFAPYQGVVAQAKWVEQHSLLDDYPTVLKNSQLLFEIGRKNFLESARKNPQIDGYNYWLITDFPGGREGDAWYYGVFDQFWQPKQATPDSMRKINAPTVLLLDANFGDRCIWADRERTFKILVSHFGAEPIENGKLSWRLMSGDRTLLAGNQPGITANVGEIKEIAAAKVGPLALTKAESLELVAELKETQGVYANSWTIWAFPRMISKGMKVSIACQRQLAGALKGDSPIFADHRCATVPAKIGTVPFIKPFNPAKKPDVLISSELDGDVQRYVREGGKLVLFPKKGSLPGQSDFPLFSNQWGQGPGTVIQGGGVMDRFPHRGFCEEQFLSLMQSGTAVNVDALPKGLSPEIWGIRPVRGDVIELSQTAMLFSGRLGKGKLLICTFDVPGNLNDKHPEAFCLFQALLDYAVSEKFEPNVEVDPWNRSESSAK